MGMGLAGFALLAATAANEAPIVVTAPNLPGLALDRDRLPAAGDTLDTAALRRGGTTDMLRAMDADLPGVTLNDAQNNPWQPSLLYRGYEASPLGGDAQGLAVYVDGARFNQPFGDATNWDLIPDMAIDRLSIESANPVFGLNALGGAVAMDLKTGRSFQGLGAEGAAGSFGRREIGGEAGFHDDGRSAYVTAAVRHDDGWRDFSPSTVRQAYAQFGLDGGWGSVDLRLMGADTSLTGNGTTPVELLAVRRRSVLSYPDHTDNRYGRALLSADIALGERLRLKPVAYIQRLSQHTINGDLSDAEPCEDDETLLCLEGEEDALITGPGGAPYPAFNGDDSYAQLNHTRTRTTGYGLAMQVEGTLAANHFSAGASWDGSRTRFDAGSTIGALAEDRGFEDGQGEIAMPDGPIRPVDVVTRRDDIGLYAADMVSLGPDVDVTVAARYNHTRITLDDQIGTALSGRHVYARLNPSVGAVWRVGGGWSAYAGYAETNRAPTPAELSCADPDAPCSLTAFFLSDPDLHQVVARTVEGGVRGEQMLGTTKLRWRLGGWRATNADDIIFAASETRGRAYFRNVGRTRRQGIEAEMEAASPLWTARLSYVLTDATYRTGVLLASPDNPAADADGLIAVTPGDRLPGVARHRLKGSVIRHFAGGAWLSLDGQYASGRWLLGDEANLTRPTRGYWVANAGGGVTLLRRLELFGEVRNLFDRKYETFGGFSETSEIDFAEAPGITNPRSLSPAAPRTWMAGVRARF